MDVQKTSNLFKCLVYNGGVSLTLIDGGVMCETGIKLHGFQGENARAFSGALLCTAFLGGLLKNERGEVSAVLKTAGAIENITASVNAELSVRACMDGKTCEKASDFYNAEGFLQIVRNDGYAVPFVGACAIGNAIRRSETAEEFFKNAFDSYFEISEQLPTKFLLSINEENGEYLCAALQQLPEGGYEWQKNAENRLSDLLGVYQEEKRTNGCTETQKEKAWALAAERVFGGISCMEKRKVRYRCNCSRDYLKGVLSSLPKTELLSVLEEQGAIKIHCHYCNKDYSFVRADLSDLLQ